MAATVSFEDDLFDFIPYQKLPASLKQGVIALARQVARHGTGGWLPWTRDELRAAAGLAKKGFAALVAWMKRLSLGDVREEGAVGIQLHGLLVASVDQQQAVVSEVIQAPAPVAMRPTLAELLQEFREELKDILRPEITREYEAQKQRDARAKRKQGAGDVIDNSENVIDKTPEPEANVIDIVIDSPLRTCAFESIDSNRVEDIYISNSNRIDSRETPEPETTPAPEASPTLTIVPADVAQALVRHGISTRRADVLIETYKLDRCATVLASLPYWKFDNAGKAIEHALANPHKWPIPQQVAQQKLPLLTGHPGGVPPKVQQPSAQVDRLKEARECLTEPERQALHCSALDRLQPASRAEYDRAISLDQRVGSLVQREIREAEDAILRGRLRKMATA